MGIVPQNVKSSADVTLFGQPISEPLSHLLGQYPVPARVTESHLQRVRASDNARSVFEKGTILFREGELPHGVCIVLAVFCLFACAVCRNCIASI
jgi:hypothetical protein